MKTLTYTLLPKSMLDLKAEGMPFWSTWWETELFAREKARAITIEIPAEFPKETLNITGDDAVRFNHILSAPEYAQIIWLHYQATKEYLYGYYWSWTSSRSSAGGLVFLGGFASGGALVHGRGPSHSDSTLGVALSRQGVVPSVPLSSSSSLDLGRLENHITDVSKKVDHLTELMERHFK